MESKNVALLVFACDRYELLYKGFTYFFNKNWDHSFTGNKYFSTEEIELEQDGFATLKSGKGEWTNRLKRVLNQITEEYIIFFQEDMWLNKPMPKGVLTKIIQHTLENDIKLVKLHSSEVYKTEKTSIDFDGYVFASINKNESNFLMSHQVSLWNKQFLIDQLKDNEHPWRNERKGSKRLKKSKEKIYQIDLLAENGNPPTNSNDSGVISGEYHTISANACIQQNAVPFIKELADTAPKYAKKLAFNLANKITHDRQPKPRKVDIFKRLKNFVFHKINKK